VAAIDFCLLGCDDGYSGRFILIFRMYIQSPSSRYREYGNLDLLVKTDREGGIKLGIYFFILASRLVSHGLPLCPCRSSFVREH
jgi:hypothetical protein